MEKDQLLKLLASISSGPFAASAARLAGVIREKDVRVSVSPRAVPARELHEIYSARLDLLVTRKMLVPGIAELAAFFADNLGSSFRVVSATTASREGGAIFLPDVGGLVGCFVLT